MLERLLNLRAPNSEVADVPRVLWPFCHHQLFGDVLTDLYGAEWKRTGARRKAERRAP